MMINGRKVKLFALEMEKAARTNSEGLAVNSTTNARPISGSSFVIRCSVIPQSARPSNKNADKSLQKPAGHLVTMAGASFQPQTKGQSDE